MELLTLLSTSFLGTFEQTAWFSIHPHLSDVDPWLPEEAGAPQ